MGESVVSVLLLVFAIGTALFLVPSQAGKGSSPPSSLLTKAVENHTWSCTTGDYAYSVSISGDRGYIAAGSRDFKVYLFQLPSVDRLNKALLADISDDAVYYLYNGRLHHITSPTAFTGYGFD